MVGKFKKIIKMFVALLGYYWFSCVCKLRRVDNSKVWLLSERGVDARDNAYKFYKYLKSEHPEIMVKYVIKKNSPDSKKIDKNDLVDYGSKEHYVLFKTAGVLISTHIMGFSPDMSLFWRMDKKGLLKLKGKKVFLQHGIIYNYESSLDSDITNLDLFISSAKPEYDFIKKNNNYKSEVLKQTGLCRYDDLVDESSEENKIILIMPTFRKWLNYKSDFKKTNYYRSWNGLLNDARFIDYVETKGIKVMFYPHFEIQKHINDFCSRSKNVEICSFEKYDVQDLLKEANIMITDYSSVQFDFAYMGKEIVYYQFDKKDFYLKHYGQGYFDFDKMGFGPVCDNVDEVMEALRSGTRKLVYSKRIEDFFDYRDNNNSKRVFDEICRINKKTILHVISSLSKGGTEKYLMNLLSHSYSDYRNIVVYYNGANDYKETLDKKGVIVKKIAGGNCSRMKGLKKIIKSEGVNVVYSYTYINSAFVMLAAFMARVKTRITHSHRSALNWKVGSGRVFVLKVMITALSTDRLACNESAGESLFLFHKFQIIPNGIELDKYSFNPNERKKLRHQLKIKEDCILLGSVGRLDENKNQIFMIKVIEQLKETGGKYKLMIIGDGETRTKLSEYVSSRGLNKDVIFMGNIGDVNRYYNAMDLFLMTSFSEGFPFVLIEAQANGLPVLAGSSIAKESKINGNVCFMNLEDGAGKWAKYISLKKLKRVSPNNRINDYSIEKTVKIIKGIYEKA